jgi:hypothetical protein
VICLGYKSYLIKECFANYFLLKVGPEPLRTVYR